eukprot:1195004-Prorocentrum_minimum.AAC.1
MHTRAVPKPFPSRPTQLLWMGQGPAASVSRHDAQAYGGRCPTHLIRESANVRNPQGRQVQSREDGEKEHGVAQRREVHVQVHVQVQVSKNPPVPAQVRRVGEVCGGTLLELARGVVAGHFLQLGRAGVQLVHRLRHARRSLQEGSPPRVCDIVCVCRNPQVGRVVRKAQPPRQGVELEQYPVQAARVEEKAAAPPEAEGSEGVQRGSRGGPEVEVLRRRRGQSGPSASRARHGHMASVLTVDCTVPVLSPSRVCPLAEVVPFGPRLEFGARGSKFRARLSYNVYEVGGSESSNPRTIRVSEVLGNQSLCSPGAEVREAGGHVLHGQVGEDGQELRVVDQRHDRQRVDARAPTGNARAVGGRGAVGKR